MKRQKRRQFKKEKDIEPLSNYDIINLAAQLKIPHFHGVYMRDTLSRKSGPATQECWILNHANSHSVGSHWVACAKYYNTALYFDSFGRLPPPLEVLSYLGNNTNLYYNAKRYQNYGTAICGHLCLRFLYDFWRNRRKIRKRKKK